MQNPRTNHATLLIIVLPVMRLPNGGWWWPLCTVKQIGMGQLKGCAVEAVGSNGFPCDHAIPSGENVGISGEHFALDGILNK